MIAARPTWPNYYPLAHAVVFVVDVHDVTRLTEARQVLQVGMQLGSGHGELPRAHHGDSAYAGIVMAQTPVAIPAHPFPRRCWQGRTLLASPSSSWATRSTSPRLLTTE